MVVCLPALEGGRPDGVGPAAEGGAAPGRPCRILVVDDNADTAESLALLLRLSGHAVRTAPDGPEALKAARTFWPEVVLLDIGLPGMTGYDVARRLRQQPEPGRAVLVAVTGYGQDEDRRRAREAGFDRHLTKPVEPQALEAVLASIPPAQR